jgi:hypothetical protein
MAEGDNGEGSSTANNKEKTLEISLNILSIQKPQMSLLIM